VLITNDGGVFRYTWSSNTIQHVGNNLGFRTLQTMSGLQSLTTSLQNRSFLLAGLQDNGVVASRGTTHAQMLRGGDGGVMSISPDNVDHFYASYGLPWRREGTHNGGSSYFGLNCGLADRGLSGVYRETTPGVSPSYLFTLAPDPAGAGEFVWYKPPSATCDWQKVHTTPLPFVPVGFDQSNDPQRWTLWAWSWGDRRVAVMDSAGPGGMSWNLRTPPGLEPPQSGAGADMRLFAERSGLRPGTAYYTTATARPSRAFLTANRGISWREVTGNLRLITGNTSFFEMAGDPSDSRRLFVATDIGVFRTDTADLPYPIWYRYMEGLPVVSRAFNLEVHAEGAAPGVVRAGTYGHGFWEREITPTTSIFADGFEAGSAIAWSSAP
jgi:hypothetical protein